MIRDRVAKVNGIAAGNREKTDVCSASRLVLGTAQLGMPYGIANRFGKPDSGSAREIVEAAWLAGIREFDTAQAYGESEIALGRALQELGIARQVRIVSKLDPKLDHLDKAAVRAAVTASLKRLGVPKLYGLLLHREDNVDLFDSGLFDILRSLVADELVENIGVSLYSAARARAVLDCDVIGMIQVPANIFDRRMENAGVFDAAIQRGKQVYIRSVFLQGLFVLDPDKMKTGMDFARKSVAGLQEISNRHQIPRETLALGYVRAFYPAAKVIFGAELPEQVKGNCRSWNGDLPKSVLDELRMSFQDVDEKIITPTMWPSAK